MSEAVIVHRLGEPDGGRDGQGNPTLGPTVDITVQAIAVAPGTASESADDSGIRAANGYTLYLPFGSDIRPTDFLTIRGVDGWQVQADAAQADWASPFSDWRPGTVAEVRRSI